MKHALRFSLLALAFGVFAMPAVADEPAIEHQVRIKIVADDELLDVELDDLEIGDSQQFFTDSGKQVVATRTEEGYEIEIEGRDEPILVRTGDNAYAFSFDTDCDGDDCPKHIAITKDIEISGDGEGEARRMIFMSTDGELHVGDADHLSWTESDEGSNHLAWIEADGDAAAERLLESGALDGLDEDKRQEILDAVRAGAGGDGETNVEVKVLKIRRDHDD